jgi:Leucine-rich repeat (LRR) protein
MSAPATKKRRVLDLDPRQQESAFLDKLQDDDVVIYINKKDVNDGRIVDLKLSEFHEDTVIPPDIETLTQLRVLHLDSLSSALPKEIGRLTQLQTLTLESCRGSSLPPQIGELENLRSLHYCGGSTWSLPAEMGKLHKLERLELSCALATSPPAELWKLPSLR